VLLFSGKRKSGKDHLTEWLANKVSGSKILRLSGPIKKRYAEENGLDFEALLTSGEYKEKHRLDMIKWSEDIRNKDHGYFCRHAIDMYTEADQSNSQIWIISDCRRLTDIKYFREEFEVGLTTHVRVKASDQVRESRGWIFQTGVDDAESECGLDNATHDIVVHNEGDVNEETALKPVLEWIEKVKKNNS